MSQLRLQQNRLNELKIVVKIVAFDNDFMAKAYAAATKLPWPILLDCKRELYASYGMKRGSWWDVYNPVSITNYLWMMLRGNKPGIPGDDWRQMGGDVLIDPNGIVRLHHVSNNPHDRPSVDKILETVQDKTKFASACVNGS